MPSLSHDALILLFRNRPELAPELLRDALGVELPEYTEVRIESADLTQVVPTEYDADLVVLLVHGRPVLGVVLEVQLATKKRKRFTWPLYVTGLRARLECDACLLVIAPDPKVARWAAKPIRVGPGGMQQPLVLGPDAVPIIAEVDQARRAPELAVLSAIAHGSDDAQIASRVAFAALAASLGLEDERALLYSDLIRIAVGEAARAALEELIGMQGYEFQSEFARKHDARGRARGKAEDVIVILEERGLVVSDEQREHILATADLEKLERWIRKAVTVASTDALFE